MDALQAMDIAEIAARRAGEVIREGWSGERQIEEKSAANLVTDIDFRSEHLIRTLLARHTPNVPILGEEHGVSGRDDNSSPSEWWYVDPVDGTTNLAHRFPVVSVSIAYLREGVVQAGVVYNPILEQCFRAARGHGAYLNGERISVSKTSRLSDAMLSTGFPPGYHHDASKNNLDLFAAFSARARALRRPGSAALDLAAVAVGWFDGFWESFLNPWDTAAGWLLVEEAGGTVTRFSGAPFDPHLPEVLASNGALHTALIEVVSEVLAIRAAKKKEEVEP